MTRRLTILAVLAALVPAAPAMGQRDAPRGIVAPSAVLVEPSTGDVIFARGAQKSRAMASTTKLMTALLALENTSLRDEIVVPRYAGSSVESLAGLRPGDRMTVADLIRAMMLPSGNDAAAALAGGIDESRSAFVARMNRRARQLGLRGTRFSDPIGLSSSNRSTPEDLVKLALVLRRSPFFRAVVDSPRATLRSADPDRTVVNRIALVRNVDEVNGVKSGHTRAAGYVLVGSATRRGVTVVSAVMGDPTEAQRDADTLALLRFGLDHYRRALVLRRGATLARAKLRHRDEEVALVAARSVTRTIRRGERATTRITGAPADLEGPLPEGARVGTIEVRLRGRVVDRVPLVTAEPVAESTVLQRVGTFAGRSGTLLLLGALLTASLLLALLRRRMAGEPDPRPRRRPRDELA